MQIIVDSLLTHYEQTGKRKRSVLLLHGWGDNLGTFKSLQQALSQDYTVISVDLPGFGATQAAETVWNLDNYAHFVADFLEKLDQKPSAIVAHSNGAAVAIRGLAADILSTEKLVILGGAGIRDRQKGRRAALKVIAKTGKVATFWLPARHKKKLQKALYGAAGSDMLVAPHLQETFKKTVRQDVQADASKLTLPVLLMYGDNDKATPPLFGKIYHKLMKNSKLDIVEHAEHFVHQDQPGHVEQAIEEFLK